MLAVGTLNFSDSLGQRAVDIPVGTLINWQNARTNLWTASYRNCNNVRPFTAVCIALRGDANDRVD
jgi:hypothetical protein